MSLSKLVGAPVEVPIGDKVYPMSPLSDWDMAQLDEYVQARFIANVNAAFVGAPKDQWREAMSLAMREALGLSWSRPPGSKVLATLDGFARLVWQGVHRNLPDADPEQLLADIRAGLNDERTVELCRMKFGSANEVPELPDGEGKKGRPLPVRSDTQSS